MLRAEREIAAEKQFKNYKKEFKEKAEVLEEECLRVSPTNKPIKIEVEESNQLESPQNEENPEPKQLPE